MSKENGWSEHKRVVIHRLGEVEKNVKEVRKRLEYLEKQMAIRESQTRIASSIYGAFAGLIPAIVSILLSRM